MPPLYARRSGMSTPFERIASDAERRRSNSIRINFAASGTTLRVGFLPREREGRKVFEVAELVDIEFFKRFAAGSCA